MLNKVKSIVGLGKGKILACLFVASAAVDSFADGLTVPATTGPTLIGYIEDNFGVVIGVVIVSVAVNIIIGMFRKAH